MFAHNGFSKGLPALSKLIENAFFVNKCSLFGEIHQDESLGLQNCEMVLLTEMV